MKEFNVYIISSASDWDIAKKNIPFIVKNIPARKIFIVSSKEIKNDVLLIDKCDFIDENEVFSGLSFSAVHQYLEQKGFIAANTGWFLQQFIKLALAFWVDDEYYLTWDADTIPMRKIEFFDENDKPLFNLKREYFFEYFRTIKNLFGYDKKTEESFISEHMMFNKQFVIEMLDRISNDDKLQGDNFWQKIFFASDLSVPGHIKKDERFFLNLKLMEHLLIIIILMFIQKGNLQHCAMVQISLDIIFLMKYMTGLQKILIRSALKNGQN